MYESCCKKIFWDGCDCIFFPKESKFLRWFTVSLQSRGLQLRKASMRSFVMLAMVISLLIALRQIARQRLYYVMLKRGVMLDFETVSPINDPLFILLTICLAISLSHCLVVAWQFHQDEKSLMDFMVFMNRIVTRYLAHCCVFLAFLATAYDTETWRCRIAPGA